jgi:hypothetical protein
VGGISFSSEQMSKLKSAMANAMDVSQMQTAVNPEAAAENPETEEWDSKGTVLAKGTYVRVDEDQMTAWLYLVPPDRGQIYSKEELITFLERSGIVKGYHSSNLSAMIKKKVYDREILVARGAAVQEGTDGYYEYLFSPDGYDAPKIREDGSVDYSSMSALQNVKQGDKVAIYHYAVDGVDGYTVYGGEMKAKPTRNLPPMRGKGIMREEDTYYAQCDGKIELKDGKVDIQNVHEIMGDVDMIIGKIEFFGDVIINGNVESGVTIRAGRNIEIHGTTGGAKLFAGGDVILSRGIQGDGKISARGNVMADFIENATVEAGGMVQANSILNAKISAQDKVVTTGKRGVILGGYTHAVKGIEVMTAGNEVEIKTVLHCGYEPEQFDKLVEARQKEKDIKAKLSELVETMTEALREKRMRGSMTSRTTEAKLSEWNQLKDEYFAELDKLESEQERLEEIMSRSKGAYIRIDGNLYRNVVICINSERMIMDRNTCFMKYTADRGIIEGSVIVHN